MGRMSTVSKTILSQRWVPRSLMRAARYAHTFTPSVLASEWFILIVHVFGVHGRRSDRCLTTDARSLLSRKLRFFFFSFFLKPNCRTSGLQPGVFFPMKFTSRLSRSSTTVPCHRQLVRTFHVLDQDSFPHCPALALAGRAVSRPP
jgi:hypothetical protein